MAYTTINKPADYFNTKLYSGDSNTTQAITGVGFQPDWVWIKARTEVHQHNLFDVIRGVTKNIVSNGTNAEVTTDQYGYLASFDSDGFTTQKGSNTNQWNVNQSGEDYVAWNWLAGGTASDNTDGDVTSSVSANTTSGFSVVTVSNLNSNSFGHGLGAEPHLIINKRTDDVANWRVYYKGIASGKSLFLNSNGAETTESSAIASATSSTVTVTGSGNGGTAGTGDTVYYCFAPKKGFSKIGTYTGNGNADGTFIYTGFKPAFVMVKRTDTTNNWLIFDSKRDIYNAMSQWLLADTSNAEPSTDTDYVDFVSNGIKFRRNGADTNASGGTYLYMAFAENPLVTSGGTPATAR